jgi:starch phosphorylase
MAKTNSEVDRTIVEEIKEKYKYHLKYSLAKDEYTATTHDKFLSLAYSVRDRLIERWIKTQQQYYDNDAKKGILPLARISNGPGTWQQSDKS